MDQAIVLSRVELIRMVGETIVWLDVTRSGLARLSADRVSLDNLRDQLDSLQRIFVRNALHAGSARYAALTATLAGINDALAVAAADASDLSGRLELLVDFVDAAQQLASLA